MGDIADMMIDGLLDEETGEYIGDYNLEKYGTYSPGFPVSIERDKREKEELKAQNIARNAAKKKIKCRECGKKVKEVGIHMHMKDVHNK